MNILNVPSNGKIDLEKDSREFISPSDIGIAVKKGLFKDGSVRGLRAKGAISIDLIWKDGKLISAGLAFDRDGEYVVRYGENTVCIKVKAGEPFNYI